MYCTIDVEHLIYRCYHGYLTDIINSTNNYFFLCGCRSRWIPCCRVSEESSLWKPHEAPKIFYGYQISYQCVWSPLCLIRLFMKIKPLGLYVDCILAAHKCDNTGSLSFTLFVYIALLSIEKQYDIWVLVILYSHQKFLSSLPRWNVSTDRCWIFKFGKRYFKGRWLYCFNSFASWQSSLCCQCWRFAHYNLKGGWRYYLFTFVIFSMLLRFNAR